MSNDTLDQAFARHVRQIGLVTQEQINTALQAQSASAKEGKPLGFSEVLVQMGIITPGQRESLEKKVKDQQAGVQQLGDFKLVRKLGEGGMGAVYLATDAAGKSVAVKVLPRAMGTNAEFVKRFRREAEAATKLKHPNIIGASFAGEDLGYHYYVMEYCDGTPLDKLLVAQKTLPVGQAILIALEIARGLKYAHDLGIIHRDIKPSNIMIARDGEARLLDLGLSKDIADTALSFKTVTGAVLGTPHYISPEQAQGEKRVDGRSDIYSLGATLYHLVTGRTPFDGATALEILSKHVNTNLPNPQDIREDIPDPVVHVLERMMAKNPSDRYHDCGELITDLVEASQGRTPKSQAIAASLTTIAPPVHRAPLKKRPASTRRVVAETGSKNVAIYGGLAAAAVALVLVYVMAGSKETPPEPAKSGPNPGARIPVDRPEKQAFDVATWEKSIAELPPEARVKGVHARLKTLNPGYDGSGSDHQINHGRVTRLRLSHPALRDISPLRALVDLRELELARTEVADLSPLQDAKLALLVIEGSKVTDLQPLRSMKDLSIVSLTGLPLKSLASLEGLDLARLTVKNCGVADLSPLKRVRLRELLCDFDAARDTDLLKSMPALEQINGTPVEEFWRRLRTTDAAAAPPSTPPDPADPFAPVLAKLKKANPDWGGRETHTIKDGQVTDLVIVALGVTDLSPLSGLGSLRRLDCSGYWSTSERKEYRSKLKDLSPLRGLPLQDLSLHHTDVSDLSPLKGMPLESLECSSTAVADLTPLRGMPLKTLNLAYADVKSIAPLAGLPLTTLHLDPLDIADYGPLAGLPLKVLDAQLQPQKHAALVQSIRTLEKLNGKPVYEFLKPASSAAAGPPPADAAQWKNALDLIPHMDPQRDTVLGPWRKDGSRIYCDGGENAVLRIPYEPPAEYDFRIVFSRTQGHCSTSQFLVREGRTFFWEMGGYGNAHSGMALVARQGSSNNPTKAAFVVANDQRYTSLVEVRKDRVTAYVDGRRLSEWVPIMGELSSDPNWSVDVPNLLGLGNCESQTVFESIQIREVTGRGRLRTTLATPPDAAFLKQVAALAAAEQVRRVVDKLKELNPGFDSGTMRYKIENERVVEFSCSPVRLTDAWPVRALPFLRRLEIGEERANGHLADLGFLRGLKLQELALFNTRATDFAPLTTLPLNRLLLAGPTVKDLSFLRGMKLTALSISGSAVTDFGPLKDLPIQKLDVERIPSLDYSPLRQHRTLKIINEMPAADFLKGVKEGWMPLFDGRSADCLRNTMGWKFDRGALVNDPAVVNSAQTKFEFENGDLRVRFEGKGWDSLAFRVRQSERGATGLFFDGIAVRPLEGKPHELIFTCRGDVVTATLDGKPIPVNQSDTARSGCFQFNATGGVLRVLGLDYRAAP